MDNNKDERDTKIETNRETSEIKLYTKRVKGEAKRDITKQKT